MMGASLSLLARPSSKISKTSFECDYTILKTFPANKKKGVIAMDASPAPVMRRWVQGRWGRRLLSRAITLAQHSVGVMYEELRIRGTTQIHVASEDLSIAG